MTNEELLTELRTIADKCNDSDEQQSIKAVLLSTMSAVHSGRQIQLMNHVCEFSQRELLRLTANRN